MKSLVLAILAVWVIMETVDATLLPPRNESNTYFCCSNLTEPATPIGCRKCIHPPPRFLLSHILFEYEECRLCFGCYTVPDEMPFSNFTICPDLLGIVRDPHFIVENHHTGNKLCFDYTGTSGQMINLVEDEASGIHVSGLLHGWNPQKSSTVFSQFRIKLGVSEIEIGFEDITLDDETTSWTSEAPLTVGDITVMLLKRDVIHIHDTHTGVTFTVTRHKGDNIGYYLGIYVTERGSLSPDTTGMLGQFFFADTKIESNLMTVTFQNGLSREVPVSLNTRSTALSVAAQEQCWHYDTYHDDKLTADEKQQGDNLLGDYQQYIIDYE